MKSNLNNLSAAMQQVANFCKAVADGKPCNVRALSCIIAACGVQQADGAKMMPLRWKDCTTPLDPFARVWAVRDSCGGVRFYACSLDLDPDAKDIRYINSTPKEVQADKVPREIWRDLYLWVVAGIA